MKLSKTGNTDEGSGNGPPPVHQTDYHSVLLKLKKLDKTNLNEFLKKVLEVVADVLKIDRVSIWFYNAERSSIYCDYLYLRESREYTAEEPLYVKDYPEYFKAIESQLYIASNDAINVDETKELTENYLKPRDIVSLMDIPIHFKGETIGIICSEVRFNIRTWQREEMDFTTAISSLISISLEIDFRKKKEKDFAESQRFLTTLISNLPGYVYRVVKEDETWSIQYISDGVLDLTGYKPDELVSNRVLYYSMMINEEDRINAKEIISKALVEKKPYQINYRINTRKGELKWVWEQGRGVYNEDGELFATEGFITDITDKKLFEEELIKRNREISALYHFGKSLSKLAEPTEIAEDIGVLLSELFNTDSISVALYNEDKNFISFPFQSKEGIRIVNHGRQFGSNLTEHVITSRKPLLLNSDISQKLEALGIPPDSLESKSLISSPIIAGDRVLGVITIQDYRSENKFSEQQIDLLTAVASQAAIALENSYLYSEVTRSLKDKEVLLKEIHHRVKNNLQVMSSLIKLQTRYLKDEDMLQIMRETGSRIQSMSIVHTKLYSTGDYENIDFAEYVRNLADNFQTSYGFKLRNVRFKIDIEQTDFNIDTAIPCGLIINELVSNSIKYAFPENQKGEILISLVRDTSNKYILTVSDNGIGADTGEKLRNSDTLGIQLVNLLSKQMNGKLEVNTSPGKGVQYVITFEQAVYKTRK
jgi:PAS domain S-box-containing protein